MLGYKFWYKVADYGNDAWKGYGDDEFTRENAKEYLWCWRDSVIERKLNGVILAILQNLEEDLECAIGCLYEGYDMGDGISEIKTLIDAIYGEMERKKVAL